MTEATYGINKNLGKIDFDEAIDKVTGALKTEGFGVLTDIDVKATLKKKIDVDFRNYRILGACNPPLAHQALSSELLIGLLLPCNVVVEEDDGTVTASAVDPAEMFKVVNRPGMEELAGQVGDKLRAALETL